MRDSRVEFQEMVNRIGTLFECSLRIFSLSKKKSSGVSHEMAQFVLKIANLTIMVTGSACFRSLVTMSYQ